MELIESVRAMFNGHSCEAIEAKLSELEVEISGKTKRLDEAERDLAGRGAVARLKGGKRPDRSKLYEARTDIEELAAARDAMKTLLAEVQAKVREERVAAATRRLADARAKRVPVTAVVLALALTARRLSREIGVFMNLNDLPLRLLDADPSNARGGHDAEADAAYAELLALDSDPRKLIGFEAPGVIDPENAVDAAISFLPAVERFASDLAAFDFAHNRAEVPRPAEELLAEHRAARRRELEAAQPPAPAETEAPAADETHDPVDADEPTDALERDLGRIDG